MTSSIRIRRPFKTFIPTTPSPEVTEEALQVMGVAQLVLALVSTTHQTAPGCVQLSALLLDVIHSLGMRLDQTLCGLTQRVHLVKQRKVRSTAYN